MSPLVITHYGGTGFGIVLGVEAILGTLTILEGFDFIHLKKTRTVKEGNAETSAHMPSFYGTLTYIIAFGFQAMVNI